MNDLAKNISRFIASAILSSILLQQFPVQALLAQEVLSTSSVDILQLTESNGGVQLKFTPLAEGITVTARVDQEGRGDFLSIASALAEIKSGVIAVSSGIYHETELLIPENVILQGGYDTNSWQRDTNAVTTIEGSKGKTTFVLQKASVLQNIAIRTADVGVRIAKGPATLSKIAIADTKTAIQLSPYAELRLQNSDFISNDQAITGAETSKLSAFNTIFQSNSALIGSPLHSDSFIQNSSFYPDKNSLQNLRDESNTVETAPPLPQAEWQFPQTEDSTDAKSFDFTNITDTTKKTIAGPALTNANGINALQIFYQLPEGDEIRIVDRSNLSRVVFESTGQAREFRGWISVPRSTQLSLLLDLNGDSTLPLQAGINQSALIPELSYTSTTNRGMLADSAEAKLFYRGTPSPLETQLSSNEKQKLADIFSPVIQAGEEWLKGESLKDLSVEKTAFYKGFLNKVILAGDRSPYAASSNLDELALTENDSRFFSLLIDYLRLQQPLKVPASSCKTEISCPVGANGVSRFLDYQEYSLRQQTDSIQSTRGIFNGDGWNIPAGSNASLKVNFEALVNFSATWIMQPFVSTPDSKAHMVSFLNTENENQNIIALFMLPTGAIETQAYDSHGRLYTNSSVPLTWTPGRKYSFSLTNINGLVTVARNDGISLWQDRAAMQGINQMLIGQSAHPESALPLIISDLIIETTNSSNQLFGGVQSNAITASLPDNIGSLTGSLSFQTSTLCQPNGLRFKEGASDFFSISGTVEGSNCKLSLNVIGKEPALATIPTAELNSRLTLIWEWNGVSAEGTITLANKKGALVSTLPGYGSTSIKQPFGLKNIAVTSLSPMNNVIVNYETLEPTSEFTLANLINVERYEVLYSENEAAVHNGTATKVAVTVNELNANSIPEKNIPSLTLGKRYYFAVQAVLETGGTTQTTHSRNIQLTGANSSTTLEAAAVAEATLPTTLSLQTNQQYQLAYADESAENPAAAEGGRVLQAQLGEALTLTNGAPGKNSFTAWSLGKDLTTSTNSSPKHIYTTPGQYIISQLRALSDTTILKQFAFVAVGASPSDRVKVTAETWTASINNPEAPWSNKSTAKKIPALVGVKEPIYLLGKATDVAGSTDEAYTWAYKVNWGDGQSDDSEAVKAAFNLTRLVGSTKEETPLKHQYDNPGIYTIVTEVTDSQGNVGWFENTIIVSKPEAYPQQIVSLPGISRLITISGGTAPYTIEYVDGSTQTLDQNQSTFLVPVTENGTVTITDRFDNVTEIAIRTTASVEENQRAVYLPSDRKLTATPTTTSIGEVVDVKTQGESHLFDLTMSTIFHFGDVLPASLASQLPSIDAPLTFNSTSTSRTYPFLNMGLFPAILTAIDSNGRENKKSFFLEVEQARVGTQSNAGIITGSVPPAMQAVPNSVEIWQRNSQSVQLAALTPNENGRFIYFMPEDQPNQGLVSIRIKDQKGTQTSYTQNIGYSFKDRPEKLFGILETNSTTPIFNETKTLATNALTPTFFGLSKDSSARTLRVASENPTNYSIEPNPTGAWIIESQTELEEGHHTFTVLDKDDTKLSEHAFIVDRTVPRVPKVTYASWSQISGQTEPFAYVGIVAKGQSIADQYIQADSKGEFHVNFQGFNNRYILAAADEAGNVSPLIEITEKEWQAQQTNTWWPKLRPYIMWTMILLLAAGGLNYARKVRV